MPSSTSSSDRNDALMQPGMPGDDPAAAIGPVLRPLPSRSLAAAGLIALLLAVVALSAWEFGWRRYGGEPGARNSDGLWAMQRRRIDRGEGDATVIIGSSRVLFDLQLDTWQARVGERPIQLALEGTSPLFAMEDLAADPDFTGRLLVGVTPVLFFSDFSRRVGVLPYYRKESPSERVGQWLSLRLLEPWLAAYDPDFALFTLLARQAWPTTRNAPARPEVRKLMVMQADRATRMWSKVERDPAYREIARQTWVALLSRPPPPADVAQALRERQIERAVAATRALRARGVEVLFVRPPSSGPWLEVEDRAFPRASTWDVLLQRSGAPGVHFEDHPSLQGLDLPEWSHLSAADAVRYTDALLAIIERDRLWDAAQP